MNAANDLETMAEEMAAATGASLAECRAAIRVEMIRMRVALGRLSVDAANVQLAACGLVMRVSL